MFLILFLFSSFKKFVWEKPQSQTASNLIKESKQVELSSAKLSSLSWGWVELRLSWVEAELKLKLSWDWAWQVFELELN